MARHGTQKTFIFLALSTVLAGWQCNAEPAKPYSYKQLVKQTQFDPKKHQHIIEKVESILANKESVGSYLQKKQAIRWRKKIEAILREHGLSDENIDLIWYEHQRLIETRQNRKETNKQINLPPALISRVERQLKQRGLDPTRIQLGTAKTKEARAKTKLLDDERECIEKLKLNHKKLLSYPDECFDAAINHEAAHLSKHDMLLRILLDEFDRQGVIKITQACRTAVYRIQEHCADYQAADTLTNARALRALIVAWYRKYGSSHFFSDRSEHPSPWKRFCKINKSILLFNAEQYLKTGCVPVTPPFPHYKMGAADYLRAHQKSLFGIIAISSVLGIALYASHETGWWNAIPKTKL